MNILVYSVAAESGGALSVLMDFYKQFREHKENHYYFLVSTPQLEEQDNITVLRFPEIKKGWGHRLWFEYVKAPQLVKQLKIDEVFSTTNTVLPFVQVSQTLYLHNSLPFSTYRFKWNENRLFWVYQHIIARLIFHSLKRADHIITQTHWMKNAVIDQCGIPEGKIEVQTPPIDDSMVKLFHPTGRETIFFYPAAPFSYKNHRLIIEACKILKSREITDWQVLLTLNANGSPYERELAAVAKDFRLPVKFIGFLSREEVFDWYSKSILLFPSYIESFPLPLMEARLTGAPILASDMPFSREILHNYEKSKFYKITDAEKLADEMAYEVKMNDTYIVNRGGNTHLTYRNWKYICPAPKHHPLYSYDSMQFGCKAA